MSFLIEKFKRHLNRLRKKVDRVLILHQASLHLLLTLIQSTYVLCPPQIKTYLTLRDLVLMILSMI